MPDLFSFLRSIMIAMNLERHPQFESLYVTSRNVDIWLPPDFDKQQEVRYPVIYMHDGQNLFYPEESFIGVDWGIDQALSSLIERGDVHPPIVVGIWNTANRVGEYLPELALPHHLTGNQIERYFQHHMPDQPFQLAGDAYLKFIVKELKPWVDLQFPTHPDPFHTFMIGASLGGLISLYGMCRYPDVFSGAGCLSTAWEINGISLLPYFENQLPDPATHRIYMDMGGKEYSENEKDTRLQEMQKTFDIFARSAGYQDTLNFLSLTFPNHEHSERFWRQRVDIPFQFLLRDLKGPND